MQPSLVPYLDTLRAHLRLGTSARTGIVRELATHLEDSTQELMDNGLSREEAATEAARRFGNPRTIAAALSLVHNQGTWPEVALSALPHLLVALLFATHRWLQLEWLGLAVVLAAGVSAVGWIRGRPQWVYAWLGYALFPFLLAGAVSMVTLGQAAWSIVARGYTPTSPLSWAIGLGLSFLGVVLGCYLLVWISRRDWLHASLLVLPIPALSVSLLALDRGTYAHLEQADVQTALLFVLVAGVVAMAVRVGDRLLKAAFLAVSLPLGFLLISGALDADPRVTLAVVLSLPALLLVLSPLLFSLGMPEGSDGGSAPRRRGPSL
ncbi:MAG: hypothetical protein HY688_01800 [Chloroflexi bacterium]|nr:hypothetical protein [Chloroflexota bacterium]